MIPSIHQLEADLLAERRDNARLRSELARLSVAAMRTPAGVTDTTDLATSAVRARLELVEGQRASLLFALSAVLKLHRGNEFQFPPAQAVLRGARALVVECEKGKL